MFKRTVIPTLNVERMNAIAITRCESNVCILYRYIVLEPNRTQSSTIMWFSFESHHQNRVGQSLSVPLCNCSTLQPTTFGTWCSFFSCVYVYASLFSGSWFSVGVVVVVVGFIYLFIFFMVFAFCFSKRIRWLNLDPFQKLNRTTFISFFVLECSHALHF